MLTGNIVARAHTFTDGTLRDNGLGTYCGDRALGINILGDMMWGVGASTMLTGNIVARLHALGDRALVDNILGQSYPSGHRRVRVNLNG